MIFYSNATTKRLEGYARHWLGRNFGIVTAPLAFGGRQLSIVSEDHEPWTSWYSLGYTIDEAYAALDAMGGTESLTPFEDSFGPDDDDEVTS